MRPIVYSIILSVMLFAFGNTQTEELPVSDLESTDQYRSEELEDSLVEDTLIQSDSAHHPIDEEQADQIRVFVNTTLIIIIIAILILAITLFLIINRVRRSTGE